MRNILIYFAIKYKGDYVKILDAIKRKEQIDKSELEKLKKQNIKALTCLDNNYPSYFKEMLYAPLVLFYEGDISLLDSPYRLGVIGSRQCHEYGKSATSKVLKELFDKRPVTIVSGLAQGIDTIAHQTAIENNQRTIAVLGTGIDICYPKENFTLYRRIKEYNLIISEYPFGVGPSHNNFPFRNRLISGISQKILVSEAAIKSGTQITIRYALEQNKDVFAIPHPIIEESFCNILISQGAKPIFNGLDIDEEFL